MKLTDIFLTVSALGIFTFLIFPCTAQTSNIKVEADPYQWEDGVLKKWNNDMVRIGITTKERGLTFRIAFTNLHETDALTVENLRIDVRVNYGDQVVSRFFKQISVSYIYLPPKENHQIYVPVDFGSYSDFIGSYEAELSYWIGSYSEYHIEPYPFEFRVVSEDQLQKEIEQKKGGPVVIIGPFEIKIFDFSISVSIVSISTILIIYYLWRRRH